MSDAKFTKGSWVITEGEFDVEVEITTDDRQVKSMGAICEMDIYFNGSHGIEQKANAHLIAAAPEMYDYLDGLYQNLCSVGDDSDTVDEIRNLLEKARGEQ